MVPYFLTNFAKGKRIRAFTSYWDDKYEPHVTSLSDPVPANPDADYENGWHTWSGASQSRLLAGGARSRPALRRGGASALLLSQAGRLDGLDTTTRKLPLDKDHNGTVADGAADYYQPGFRECVWTGCSTTDSQRRSAICCHKPLPSSSGSCGASWPYTSGSSRNEPPRPTQAVKYVT